LGKHSSDLSWHEFTFWIGILTGKPFASVVWENLISPILEIFGYVLQRYHLVIIPVILNKYEHICLTLPHSNTRCPWSKRGMFDMVTPPYISNFHQFPTSWLEHPHENGLMRIHDHDQWIHRPKTLQFTINFPMPDTHGPHLATVEPPSMGT